MVGVSQSLKRLLASFGWPVLLPPHKLVRGVVVLRGGGDFVVVVVRCGGHSGGAFVLMLVREPPVLLPHLRWQIGL